MQALKHSWEDDKLTVALCGNVDTHEAPIIEQQIFALTKERIPRVLCLDCDKLDYISSAGLRMVMRLAKVVPHVRFVEVWPEVYTLLETTGFDTLFEVTRAMRTVSVEGCPVVGRGSKGVVYRIGGDTIVKVTDNENALDEISHEREVARAAFIAGIPTAISYDVVRVGNGYGSVFELLDVESLADMLAEGKMSVEEVAARSVDLLRQIHKTKADLELMPDIREQAVGWLRDARPALPADQYAQVHELVEAIPENDAMVHGDFHIKNIMVQGDECLLIDMATLSHGDAVFELAPIYNTYVGRGLVCPQSVEDFMGVPYEVSRQLWDLTLRGCMATDDPDALATAHDRISIMSALRMLGHPVRQGYADTDQAQKVYATFGQIVAETLPRVDSLTLG